MGFLKQQRRFSHCERGSIAWAYGRIDVFVLKLGWHDESRLHVVWRNLVVPAVLVIGVHHWVAEPADPPLDNFVRRLLKIIPSNGLKESIIEARVTGCSIAVRSDSVSVVV